MAEDQQPLEIFVGYDRELVLARRDFRREIDELSIELADDGRLGQTAADRLGDLANRGVIGNLSARTIGKNHNWHRGLSFNWNRIFYALTPKKENRPAGVRAAQSHRNEDEAITSPGRARSSSLWQADWPSL